MIMSSQSRLLYVCCQYDGALVLVGGKTYFSVKVRFRSHVMIGKLRRSLYVGSSTEYLSFF